LSLLLWYILACKLRDFELLMHSYKRVHVPMLELVVTLDIAWGLHVWFLSHNLDIYKLVTSEGCNLHWIGGYLFLLGDMLSRPGSLFMISYWWMMDQMLHVYDGNAWCSAWYIIHHIWMLLLLIHCHVIVHRHVWLLLGGRFRWWA